MIKKPETNLVGCIAKDIHTGYTGLVVAKTKFMYGCSRYLLQSTTLDDNGELSEPEAFDEQQIEFVSKSNIDVQVATPKLELGNEVRDRITGIEGIVSSITMVLYNEAPHVGIMQRKCLPNGKPAPTINVHEPRVELLKPKKPKNVSESKKPGGPRKMPSLTKVG